MYLSSQRKKLVRDVQRSLFVGLIVLFVMTVVGAAGMVAVSFLMPATEHALAAIGGSQFVKLALALEAIIILVLALLVGIKGINTAHNRLMPPELYKVD